MKKQNSFSFLTIGKTSESRESQEFKRYVGIASSYVLAVNPDKKTLDDLMGFKSANAPEYVVKGENGKEVRINFIVKTDPEANNGIEIVTRASFIMRNAPDYNRDQTKVRIIDTYGNTSWMNTEDAKQGKKPVSAEGKELKVDSKYRMACVGEADLVSFLKTYLGVQDVFNYVDGSWVKKPNDEDYKFGLDNIKEYFNGNFTELKEALKLQPNNKVKLLYGVRTDDKGNQYQTVCTRDGFVLRNNAGVKAYDKIEERMKAIKALGSYPTTEFKVQELTEWKAEATNLETPSVSSGDMPWD